MNGLTEVEMARHADERGRILLALHQEYGREMTSVRSLRGALDLLGYSLSQESLEFSLVYLAESGYLKIWRLRDTPAWRPDRDGDASPERIVFAKLLPKGVRLIDGREPADAGVRF